MSEKFKLAGLEMKYFIPITLLMMVASYLEILPKGMLGAFPVLILLGAIFDYIGNKTPIINSYLGGGPIVIIFASAALVYYNIFPQSTVTIIKNFMGVEGFLDFYIAALVTGSILGMNKKLLIKAIFRYLPIIIGGVAMALIAAGITGVVLGYGFKESVFYIAIPIMGGGTGAGTVPISKIMGEALNRDPGEIMSTIIPAVTLGNAFSIILAGFLDKLGKKYPALTGEGKLLRSEGEFDIQDDAKESFPLSYESLGIGLIFATFFFILGQVLGAIIPIHPYAILIIAVSIAKVLGLISSKYEEYAAQWYNFILKNFTAALLVGIGIGYTSFGHVVAAMTPNYIILVAATVIGVTIGTGVMSHLLGFYAIEGAITAGLCMTNMGGTGDVAVLSSAKRMGLMPFAQISTRIGGAFILILATVLVGIFK